MDEVVDDLVIFNRGLAAFGPVSKAPLTTDAPCTPNMNLREIDKWARVRCGTSRSEGHAHAVRSDDARTVSLIVDKPKTQT